jgi:hypothetical protein
MSDEHHLQEIGTYSSASLKHIIHKKQNQCHERANYTRLLEELNWSQLPNKAAGLTRVGSVSIVTCIKWATMQPCRQSVAVAARTATDISLNRDHSVAAGQCRPRVKSVAGRQAGIAFLRSRTLQLGKTLAPMQPVVHREKGHTRLRL